MRLGCAVKLPRKLSG